MIDRTKQLEATIRQLKAEQLVNETHRRRKLYDPQATANYLAENSQVVHNEDGSVDVLWLGYTGEQDGNGKLLRAPMDDQSLLDSLKRLEPNRFADGVDRPRVLSGNDLAEMDSDECKQWLRDRAAAKNKVAGKVANGSS